MFDYILERTGLKSKAKKEENDAQPTEEPKKDTKAAEKPALAPPDQQKVEGMRVSGKQWKVTKGPMRSANKTKWDQRRKADMQLKAMKQQEKDMKNERKQEREERINKLKEKRAAKEEKERYELMAKKMHAKRVARIRNREKRNKLLKER